MSNKITYILLALIIFLSIFLRFWKLDQVPASLNWDEVAAGYNAYTIANWGADEYGNKFPIVFKSFADDKHPIHIYMTAVVVKIFGLSDFATRSSSAMIGVLSVIAIFFLAKELLKNNLTALFASLFFAVSPYSIHFSRGLWENNFAIFFLITGLACFYIGLRKSNFLLPLAFLSFGLSFLSYHSAKIIVPIVVLIVCLINFKYLISNKKILIWPIIITLFFAGLIIKEPRILGFARINQTKLASEVSIVDNYKKYFGFNYLFNKGDEGPRASVKTIGQFYKIDLVLSLIGLVFLFTRKKWQILLLILIWLLVAPTPGAVSSVEPSAIRGIFTIGPILLLSAVGASSLILIFKNKFIQIALAFVILIFLAIEVINYTKYYFNIYSVKEAIEWQYGMKQIVEYLKNNPQYARVYQDKIRQQPYIFYLYYFKTPLPELLKSVKYDQSGSKSYNTVFSFSKYQFGGWDIIESYPNLGVVYIVTPSYYSGLRYINDFEVKNRIKYPDGSDAFYIVEGQK